MALDAKHGIGRVRLVLVALGDYDVMQLAYGRRRVVDNRCRWKPDKRCTAAVRM